MSKPERLDCAALDVCPCDHKMTWWQRLTSGPLYKCSHCHCYRILGNWRKPFYSQIGGPA